MHDAAASYATSPVILPPQCPSSHPTPPPHPHVADDGVHCFALLLQLLLQHRRVVLRQAGGVGPGAKGGCVGCIYKPRLTFPRPAAAQLETACKACGTLSRTRQPRSCATATTPETGRAGARPPGRPCAASAPPLPAPRRPCPAPARRGGTCRIVAAGRGRPAVAQRRGMQAGSRQQQEQCRPAGFNTSCDGASSGLTAAAAAEVSQQQQLEQQQGPASPPALAPAAHQSSAVLAASSYLFCSRFWEAVTCAHRENGHTAKC